MVSKSASTSELLVALRTVAAGHIYVPPSITEQPKNWCIDTRAPKHVRDLTRRQSEIIALMSEGKSNKAIARALGISPSTVKVHLHAAYRALGVHCRIDAAWVSLQPEVQSNSTPEAPGTHRRLGRAF